MKEKREKKEEETWLDKILEVESGSNMENVICLSGGSGSDS